MKRSLQGVFLELRHKLLLKPTSWEILAQISKMKLPKLQEKKMLSNLLVLSNLLDLPDPPDLPDLLVLSNLLDLLDL